MTQPPAGPWSRRAIIAGLALVPLLAPVVGTPLPAYADGIRAAQWHLAALDLARAHRVTRGAGVLVAVVDSGVDANHPDLTGAVRDGVDVGAAPTGAPTAAGRDDLDGRGTALAGLIAARGRPDGALGVAPEATILPVVFAARPGETGDPDRLAAGIDEAVRRRAGVICVARGVPDTPGLRAAVAAAVRSGAVVVAADGDRPGAFFAPFPSSYPGVLTAVPTDRAGRVSVPPASERTDGIGAPGVDVLSTNTRGGYRIDGGTSAAAVLAGAVALVRAAFPKLTGAQAVQRIRASGAKRPGVTALDLPAALGLPVPEKPGPTPTGTAPAGAAERPWGTPAFASRDWRRWLVAAPLAIFLIGLAGVVFRASRRRRRATR
jgi:subtilisin family serine protease